MLPCYPICMGFDIIEMSTISPASPWTALPLSLHAPPSLLSPFLRPVSPCFLLRRASWLVCCPIYFANDTLLHCHTAFAANAVHRTLLSAAVMGLLGMKPKMIPPANFVCCFLLYGGSIESQCVTALDASLSGNKHIMLSCYRMILAWLCFHISAVICSAAEVTFLRCACTHVGEAPNLLL